MSTLQSIAREALATDSERFRWLVEEGVGRIGSSVETPRLALLQIAAAALGAVAEGDLLEGDLREGVRTFSPAHAYAFNLLAEHPEGLTHGRLFTLWQARSARTASPWPWISESGARTRVAELKAWGIVEDSGREGRTPANRPTAVWQLAADFKWSPPPLMPEALEALHALQLEAGTNVVTGSLLARLAAVEVAR